MNGAYEARGLRVSLAVAAGMAGIRLNRMGTDGSSGGMELEGPMTSFTFDRWHCTPRSAALSPDGKTLYVTGFVFDTETWRYADRRGGFQYRAAIDSWAPGDGGPLIWLVPGGPSG